MFFAKYCIMLSLRDDASLLELLALSLGKSAADRNTTIMKMIIGVTMKKSVGRYRIKGIIIVFNGPLSSQRRWAAFHKVLKHIRRESIKIVVLNKTSHRKLLLHLLKAFVLLVCQ